MNHNYNYNSLSCHPVWIYTLKAKVILEKNPVTKYSIDMSSKWIMQTCMMIHTKDNNGWQ